MATMQIWAVNDTSIRNKLGSVADGYSDFAYVIEYLLFQHKLETTYESDKFGEVVIKLYTQFLDDNKWKAHLVADITINSDLEVYSNTDELCKNLYKIDTKLAKYIKDAFIKFAKTVNESIDMSFPVKETFVYNHSKYYIEANEYDKPHEIEWCKVALGTNEYDFDIKDPEIIDY